MLWKDKYSLGVPLIDAQHKELFSRVEAFMTTLRSDASWEQKVQKVNETLAFMQNYVVEHFRDEEQYQIEVGYPGYSKHKEIHDGMVKYVGEVAAEYERRGCDEQLMQQFCGKLVAWLINHVAAEDMRLAKYAIEKGVQA